MGTRRSKEEWAEIGAAYEGDEDTDTIAERYGMTVEGLRSAAYKRGWKRDTKFYRKGPPPTSIPDARRADIEAMWWSGDSAVQIARLLNVTSDTAFLTCTREFGRRDARLAKQLFVRRRNLQLYFLRRAGVSMEALADFYRLAPNSVERCIRQMRVELGDFTPLKREVSVDVGLTRIKKRELAVVERYERAAYEVILSVCDYTKTQPQYILMDTRRGNVSHARHIAMYILNTEFNIPASGVSLIFGRDRSTVSHALARVEDMRENPTFDADVFEIAEKVTAILRSDEKFMMRFGHYLTQRLDKQSDQCADKAA